MVILIGILVVFGSVVGGYLLEHGNIMVLLQPAELLIIGGAGVGTLLVANPPHILKKIGSGVARAFAKPRYTKDSYLGLLKTMYELLTKARKDGMMAVEADVEKPEASVILGKNTILLHDHHALDFLCDSLRMVITGFEVYELDQVLDLEVHHSESAQPVNALTTMADSLPGLGIVAVEVGRRAVPGNVRPSFKEVTTTCRGGG